MIGDVVPPELLAALETDSESLMRERERLWYVACTRARSQIAVWDAIGAIARGSQVVIVGDPQQLPPTSVGQRTDMDEDDGATVQSQQSILDECLASNLPSLRLDWHYRSRHESLIAFSNAKYYRGELVSFPSSFTTDTAVRLVPVLGGVYDRGKSKVNRTRHRIAFRGSCEGCA